MKILALSGSLRAASINSALLQITAQLAPVGVEITVFNSMADLPLFNPDLEQRIPAAVRRLQQDVAEAHAV
ncbi:MAG TPA: NAD(P)H-dependent oxidoreductase, partial [Pseudomonadales bacterium]|nr:NAD(P)H-dependent oxidoreductase [Pseudomonadales bacterium]